MCLSSQKRQRDEYHWLEADLLNLAAGPLGCWGHEGKVSGEAKCELWQWRVVPLLGEGVWGDLVRTSLQLHLVMPCKQVDAIRSYNLLIHSETISELNKVSRN